MRWLSALLLASCIDERHVMVRDSTTSPERRYACKKAPGPATNAPYCEDATVDLPGKDNGDDTVVVAIPYQCKGRVNEVYVHNAHSKDPTVYVRCAAAETRMEVIGATDGGAP